MVLPKLSPEELVGITFIRNDENGNNIRAKVVQKINDDDAANHQTIKFLVEKGNGDIDEIMAYAELANLIETQQQEAIDNPDRPWTYKAIIGHEGPLTSKNPKYKGRKYNVLVLWEDGTETYEH